MTDEKIIDAEFDKDDAGPFDSPISAYKAGFRAAERSAKIEVLAEICNSCDLDCCNECGISNQKEQP